MTTEHHESSGFVHRPGHGLECPFCLSSLRAPGAGRLRPHVPALWSELTLDEQRTVVDHLEKCDSVYEHAVLPAGREIFVEDDQRPWFCASNDGTALRLVRFNGARLIEGWAYAFSKYRLRPAMRIPKEMRRISLLVGDAPQGGPLARGLVGALDQARDGARASRTSQDQPGGAGQPGTCPGPPEPAGRDLASPGR